MLAGYVGPILELPVVIVKKNEEHIIYLIGFLAYLCAHDNSADWVAEVASCMSCHMGHFIRIVLW
jgi:hypothetical protein